jgi:poly(A) polymerase
VQFLGHAEKGAAMFRKIARRLAFTAVQAETIHFLILKHLRASQYEGQWNDSAVRRFYREAGEHLEDLLDLSRADITTRRAGRKAEALKHIDELSDRIRTLMDADARVPSLPAGLGNHIMKRFDLKPGPLVGKLRDLLEEAVEQGDLEAQREPDHYLEYLARRTNEWNS